MAKREMPSHRHPPSQPSAFSVLHAAVGTTFGRRLGTPKHSQEKMLTSQCDIRNFYNSTLKISGAKSRKPTSRIATDQPSSRGKGVKPSFPLFLVGIAFFFVAASALPAAPVTVTKLSGNELRSDLKTIDADNLVFADGTKLALSDVRAISLSSGGGSRDGTESVFLSCGSTVHGTGVVLTEEEEVTFLTTGGSEASFPIDAVLGIRFLPERKDSLFERNLAGKGDPDHDRVYVPQGSELRELSGLVDTLSADQVSIDRSGALVEVPRAKVYGLLFAKALTPDLDGLNAQVLLSDGSTVRGKISGLKEGVLSLAMVEKSTLSLPLRAVQNIRLQPPNLVYISDLEPESAVVQPVVAPTREWRRDRNVLDGSLQLGRQVFEKGLGLAGGTRLTFANPDETYATLTALVGIDAGRGKRGDCEAIVLGDGQELVRKRLRGGEKPIALNVDVSSVSSVVLYVEPGEDYDLSDHVNWCEAAFIKN